MGFLVLACGLPWYVYHVEQREIALVEQYEARQAAFDWYAGIALNALNQRSMMVGGDILLQCQSVAIVAPGGLRAAGREDGDRAEYERGYDESGELEEAPAAATRPPHLLRAGDTETKVRPDAGAS